MPVPATSRLLRAAGDLVMTEEMKPRPRKSLTDVVQNFQPLVVAFGFDMPHTELAEQILEESGYTDDVEERSLRRCTRDAWTISRN